MLKKKSKPANQIFFEILYKRNRHLTHTMSQPSAVIDFLGKYFEKSTKRNNELTHTMLNGGKIILPPMDNWMENLARAIATDIANNVPHFLNELHSDVAFRMFFDFDMYHTELLSDDTIAEIVGVVTAQIKRFFPSCGSHMFHGLVTTAPPKALCQDQHTLEEFTKSDTFNSYLQPGPAPTDAVLVSYACEKTTAWTFSDYRTVFTLEDGSFFHNIHRDDRGRLKHGIHIHFKDLVVSTNAALYMREAVVDGLNAAMDKVYAPDGWAEIVDNAPYTTSGLRMYGAHKASNCPVCQNKALEKKTCKACRYGGKRDDGRPYTFHSAYKNGLLCPTTCTEFKKPHKLQTLIMSTMIRPSSKGGNVNASLEALEVTPGWLRFPGCPSYGDAIVKKKNNDTHATSRQTVFSNQKRARGEREIITDQKLLDILKKMIQTRFVPEYSNLYITSVYKKENGGYVIYVGGEGCCWCLNKSPPGDHKNNRIYFVLERSGLYVKCFCRCNTIENRRNGKCVDFVWGPRQLSNVDNGKFFWDKQLHQEPKATFKVPEGDLMFTLHAKMMGNKITAPLKKGKKTRTW